MSRMLIVCIGLLTMLAGSPVLSAIYLPPAQPHSHSAASATAEQIFFAGDIDDSNEEANIGDPDERANAGDPNEDANAGDPAEQADTGDPNEEAGVGDADEKANIDDQD